MEFEYVDDILPLCDDTLVESILQWTQQSHALDVSRPEEPDAATFRNRKGKGGWNI